MVDVAAAKQQISPTVTASATELAAALGLSRRRARLFALGFALAFALFTAFLALRSSPVNASPFISGLSFASNFSSSSVGGSGGTSSYQLSSIFFHFFPNSSSSPFSSSGSGITSHGNSEISGKNATFASVGGSRASKDQKNQTAAVAAPIGVAAARPWKGNISVVVAAHGSGAQYNKTQNVKAANIQGKNQTAAVPAVGVAAPPRGNISVVVPAHGGGAQNNKTQNVKEGSIQRKNQTATVAAAGVAALPRLPSKGNSSVVAAANGGGAQNKNTQNVMEANLQRKNHTIARGNSSDSKNVSKTGSDQKSNNKWINNLMNCDIFHGNWVKDDSYPLYPEGSCPHIDEPFNCYLNGRPDRGYQKLRWQPSGCKIPRLNATDMLRRLRGKRLVFVGDSLNRNMWESLVCILRNSVKDKSKVFEASGRREFKTEGSYSFLFEDYNCSVEFFRSPFLVQEWEMPSGNGTKKETLRLDIIEQHSSKYKDAHIIVFNTGHWWTHEKTSRGKDYYQEGDRVYGELNVVDAFHKALNTWAKWVDYNVNPKKSLVFFRGYSASHFSGGQWNSGGACDKETEPIKNDKYLSTYPPKMRVLETVIKAMKVPVSYLNITRMTDYRKDAHPSIYRKQNLTEEERRSPERFQDCSHWCLPGVPDSWNELLYAQLIIKQEQMKQPVI